MKKVLSIFACAFMLSGCSIFGEKIAGEVASVIDDYCKEPQQAREVYRASINAELAQDGHAILVTCAGDSE